MNRKTTLRRVGIALMLLVAFLVQGTWALAGTTGQLTGVISDAQGAPVAGATVKAEAPSGSATTTTDGSGHFGFLTLAPDTYTVSASKAGYTPVSITGVTVFADNAQNVSLRMATLKEIGAVTSRSNSSLVKSGTTSDVYSVNAATQQIVSGSGGGFNLNSAYSAIYQQPGVTSSIGNYGWGQVFFIRGGSYSQTGYEYDGIPVNRAFDNYQANSLSSLGQQELQVYTGGSPAGASSATLGGFINQVIKTGTYPGSGTIKAGIASPGFYHGLSAEAGGASPNRLFSYYVGVNGFNQHYPFGDFNNMNGIAYDGSSSYGILAPGESATLLGGLGGPQVVYNNGNNFTGNINVAPADAGKYLDQYTNGPFAACTANGTPAGYTAANPGTFNGACVGYGPFGSGYLSDQFERNTVLNFHFGIPHKRDAGRDDIQLLYDNSMQYAQAASSQNDVGGANMINGFLTPFATADCGFGPGTTCGNTNALGNPYTGPYPGFCGYENAFGLGCTSLTSPLPFVDSKIFAPGTSFGQAASTATVLPYYFPSSNQNRPLNTPFAPTSGIPLNQRDGQLNDVGIIKLQYTKNIGSNAFARLFGYTFYSDWLLNGADCAATQYLDGLLNGGLCGETANYELTTHTRGAEFQFADQINEKNLLQFTANYTTASVARFNNGSWLSGYLGSRSGVTNLTNGDPNNPLCFSRKTGAQGSCYSSSTYGTFFGTGVTRGQAQNPCGTTFTVATTPAAFGPTGACTNGAQWLVTVPGGQGTFNTVRPVFTSLALTDDFKPNDKLDLNVGLRAETYQYNLQNSNTPEFNFWFNAAAQVNCYDPGTGLPMLTPLQPGQPVPPNPVTTAPNGACGTAPSGQQGLHPTGGVGPNSGPLKYTATSPASFTHTLLSPRVGLTYTVNPDTVLRFSAGKYTQPTETAFEQYLDQSGKRAANFDFGRFWGLGFYSPAHDNPVQYSNNYDGSIEHHFKGTDMSAKLSPFYRDTHNQIETLVLGPGFVSGVNVGHQHSYGVEFALSKGDPSRDGWAGQLAYTYTKALVQYGSLPNGTNNIDYLNNYVKAFNALTQAGGGAPCYNNTLAADPNSGQIVTVGTTADPTCSAVATATTSGAIKNPYYGMAQQGLLDRNGWYQTYPNESPNDPLDQGGSSAIAPHVFTGFVQYKHGRLAIAPNFTLLSGTYYGSPTDTYGIDPRTCTGNQAAAVTALGAPVLPVGSPYAQNADFLTCGASTAVQSGYLAIPNPYNGRMDSVGQYQQPWQFNLGALIRYNLSDKTTANLSLTNIVNRCFGGSSTPWSSAFAPNNVVCGYGSNAGGFIGTQPGAGFFYGANGADPANGGGTYPRANNYPFAPFAGKLPFQAYLEVQFKI